MDEKSKGFEIEARVASATPVAVWNASSDTNACIRLSSNQSASIWSCQPGSEAFLPRFFNLQCHEALKHHGRCKKVSKAMLVSPGTNASSDSFRSQLRDSIVFHLRLPEPIAANTQD